MTAKTLLPVEGSTLLWRQLDQLQAAGAGHVVVCTTPPLAQQLEVGVSRYERAASLDIEILVSQEQQRGTLHGLNEVVPRLSGTACLVCLGDIFFLDNPFEDLCKHMQSGARAQEISNVLGVTSEGTPAEMNGRGLIFLEEGSVETAADGSSAEALSRQSSIRSIAAVQDPGSSSNSGRRLRWSGNVRLNRAHCLEDLAAFLPSAPPDAPLEDLLEFQRRKGRHTAWIDGPDFVNVNTPADLTLATLYATLENLKGEATLSRDLQTAADSLRNALASGTAE